MNEKRNRRKYQRKRKLGKRRKKRYGKNKRKKESKNNKNKKEKPSHQRSPADHRRRKRTKKDLTWVKCRKKSVASSRRWETCMIN